MRASLLNLCSSWHPVQLNPPKGPVPASVHSGCCDTRDWAGYKIAALEARKFTIKTPADSVSDESPLPGPQTATISLCLLHMAQGMREHSGISLKRTRIPS